MINIFKKIKSLLKRKTQDKYVGIGVCFICFKGRDHKEEVFLPVGFDLDALIQKYPPVLYGFKEAGAGKFHKYKIYAFLFHLTSIPARNSDVIEQNGLIRIHMKTISNHISDISLYVRYLEQTGVIEVNQQYIPRKKSRGYKWSAKYEQDDFEERLVSTGYSEDVAVYKEEATDIPENPHLFHWYQTGLLEINPHATAYANAIKRMKFADKSKASWDWNQDKNCYKYPLIQCNAVLMNIAKIKLHMYEPHLDHNIHRLHSVLTNLQKDFRNFLRFDKQTLTNIDIKNCQPYLSCLIFNPDFWREDSALPLNLYSLPENIQEMFTASPQLLADINLSLSEAPADAFSSYIECATAGEFYENLVDIVNQRKGLDKPITRKNAKTLMFNILFSSNKGAHKDRLIRDMKKYFSRELYPHVADLFRIIKQKYPEDNGFKSHARLACLLQAIESHIILARCCKRIWDEGQETVPVFTIHDSISTLGNHVDFVKKIMQEELTTCIGYPPSLDTETWQEDQLKYPNIFQQIAHQ